MSNLNITPINFENGLTCIATNKNTEADLQIYIDTYEKEYLTDLLGCELYDLFIQDLSNGVPQTQIYIDIFEPFCKDENGCGVQIKSKGMIEMLKEFIYFEYTRDQKVKNTNTGNIVNENEVSREANFIESRIFPVYNRGVENYNSIQWLICDKETNYPTFNGSRIEETSWI